MEVRHGGGEAALGCASAEFCYCANLQLPFRMLPKHPREKKTRGNSSSAARGPRARTHGCKKFNFRKSMTLNAPAKWLHQSRKKPVGDEPPSPLQCAAARPPMMVALLLGSIEAPIKALWGSSHRVYGEVGAPQGPTRCAPGAPLLGQYCLLRGESPNMTSPNVSPKTTMCIQTQQQATTLQSPHSGFDPVPSTGKNNKQSTSNSIISDPQSTFHLFHMMS